MFAPDTSSIPAPTKGYVLITRNFLLTERLPYWRRPRHEHTKKLRDRRNHTPTAVVKPIASKANSFQMAQSAFLLPHSVDFIHHHWRNIILGIIIVISSSTLARTGTDTSETVTIANLAGTLLVDNIAVKVTFGFKQPIINEMECRQHIGLFGGIHIFGNVESKIVGVGAQFLGNCRSSL